MCRRVRRSSLVAAFLVGALLCASPAFSAQDPVIADCIANQQVTGNYTLAQLRHALNTLSPTTKEYTNCYDAINRAIAAKVGGGNGSSNSSGGSFLPTPLIIILVVLVLAAGAYGVLALRNRAQTGHADGDGEGGDGGSGDGAP